MIEPQYHSALSHKRQDLEFYQQRASQQRRRYRQFNQLIADVRQFAGSFFSSPVHTLRQLPLRYILHAMVALIVPLALGLSHVSTWTIEQDVAQPNQSFADMPTGMGPVSFDNHTATNQRLGDPPLPDTDALPMPISLVSRRDALAPVVVPARVAFERVRVRNGPGLEYDNVGMITGDTEVEVIGRHGEWLQVRRTKNGASYWIAGELLNIPKASIYTLFEVSDADIPPPPPPRIGTVRESALNLRDGPGTNYVSMIALEAGTTFELIEQYQGWAHVASNQYDGWVKTEFLNIEQEIMHRVPETEYIPDPNPALVGELTENLVNMREGPGKVYHSVTTANAGTVVDLLAQHGDWYKVQLRDGTNAWVFGDLIYISPMARRRVPYTNDIPPEPAPVVQVARTTSSGGGGYATTSNNSSSSSSNSYSSVSAVEIPASGDVASYALQFVGYPYVYGGASPGSGFDCSGLVQYVYRQYGVYLPRVAASQYSTAYGAAVGSMSNLAPGDLMFFAGTAGPGISHVAMYIGGGRMVHAMTPALGVGVSSIWDGYWVGHYYGAIRPYR